MIPLVKICGLTRPEDAEQAFSLGADYLGLIFAPSRRRVTVEQAKCVMDAVPTFNKFVGVFQDQSKEDVSRTAGELGLEFIQLHGKESPDYCAALTDEGFSVIKAISVSKPLKADTLNGYPVFGFLFDTAHDGRSGGTGKVFDWALVEPGIWRSKKSFLSGGLTPENIGSAIDATHPYAVDVSSGVEQSAGIKDFRKVEAFIHRVKRSL